MSTADTYYTCPKCGEARSKLDTRHYTEWGAEVAVPERVCLVCWHRWVPGEKIRFHWSDAKGALADLRPGVPSEELVREMYEE